MNDGNRRRNVVRGLAAVVLAVGLGGAVVGVGALHASTLDDTLWTQRSLVRHAPVSSTTAPSTSGGQIHALDTLWI